LDRGIILEMCVVCYDFVVVSIMFVLALPDPILAAL
jgi:hypothetical protein